MGTTAVTARKMATRHTLEILVKINRLCRVTRFQHSRMLVVMKIARKPNSGKLSFGDLNRNRELAGAGTSRFQILAQVPDEFENPVHAAFTDIPSTSRPFIPTSNPTFTSKRETTAKTLARRKPHTKAVAARTQSRKPNVPVNPICNPSQLSGLNIRENDINPLPHANHNLNSNVIPQQASSNQYVSPLATTVDPAKHTVVFCSSQTLANGDVREVATEHRERQGPDRSIKT